MTFWKMLADVIATILLKILTDPKMREDKMVEGGRSPVLRDRLVEKIRAYKRKRDADTEVGSGKQGPAPDVGVESEESDPAPLLQLQAGAPELRKSSNCVFTHRGFPPGFVTVTRCYNVKYTPELKLRLISVTQPDLLQDDTYLLHIRTNTIFHIKGAARDPKHSDAILLDMDKSVDFQENDVLLYLGKKSQEYDTPIHGVYYLDSETGRVSPYDPRKSDDKEQT